MIREQGPDDRAAVEGLLTARIDQAMFPLTNLREHGLGQGDFPSPHDHATRIWRTGNSLIALTRAGMILPLLDGSPDLTELPATLNGLTVIGAVGPSTSVRPVLKALRLDRHPTFTDRDEPGFGLDLASQSVPGVPGTTLRPITPADLPLVTGWRETYIGEVMGSTGPEARAKAETDIASYLARDSHRLLIHHDKPVAMTGFNAILPEIVQVGGVYTPPDLRNRGYARTAVALHLAEARAQGCTRAVLFAATPAAARAYIAIGFQPAADFALVLFRQPVTLPT